MWKTRMEAFEIYLYAIWIGIILLLLWIYTWIEREKKFWNCNILYNEQTWAKKE